MTKIEKLELDRLVSLSKATHNDKTSALALYKKYVNPRSIYCLRCPSSVRMLFTNLKRWWKVQQDKSKAYKHIKAV